MTPREEVIGMVKALAFVIRRLDALAKSAKIGGAMRTYQAVSIESLRCQRTAWKLLILLKVAK